MAVSGLGRLWACTNLVFIVQESWLKNSLSPKVFLLTGNRIKNITYFLCTWFEWSLNCCHFYRVQHVDVTVWHHLILRGKWWQLHSPAYLSGHFSNICRLICNKSVWYLCYDSIRILKSNSNRKAHFPHIVWYLWYESLWNQNNNNNVKKCQIYVCL